MVWLIECALILTGNIPQWFQEVEHSGWSVMSWQEFFESFIFRVDLSLKSDALEIFPQL